MPDGSAALTTTILHDPAIYGLNYTRRSYDLYPTLDRLPVHVLLSALKGLGIPLPDQFWEPSFGYGDLAITMASHGIHAVGSDIKNHGAIPGVLEKSLFDFDQVPGKCSLIVTNPPFDKNIVDEYIAHLLDLAEAAGATVCLLMRHEFDAGGGTRRRQHFTRTGYITKVVLPKRPVFELPLPKAFRTTPRHPYGWYIWDFSGRRARPIVYGSVPKAYPGCLSICGGHKLAGLMSFIETRDAMIQKLPSAERAAYRLMEKGEKTIQGTCGLVMAVSSMRVPVELSDKLTKCKKHMRYLGELVGLDEGLPIFDGETAYQSWKLTLPQLDV